MDKIDDKARVTFALPSELATALNTAAAKEERSISYLCRKALTNELRKRGLLGDDKTAA